MEAWQKLIRPGQKILLYGSGYVCMGTTQHPVGEWNPCLPSGTHCTSTAQLSPQGLAIDWYLVEGSTSVCIDLHICAATVPGADPPSRNQTYNYHDHGGVEPLAPSTQEQYQPIELTHQYSIAHYTVKQYGTVMSPINDTRLVPGTSQYQVYPFFKLMGREFSKINHFCTSQDSLFLKCCQWQTGAAFYKKGQFLASSYTVIYNVCDEIKCQTHF